MVVKITPDTEREICEAYLAGASMDVLVDGYGYSKHKIRNTLDKYKIVTRPMGGKSSVDIWNYTEVHTRYNSGETVAELAEVFKAREANIRIILRKVTKDPVFYQEIADKQAGVSC